MKKKQKLLHLRRTVEGIDKKILHLFSKRFITTKEIQNLKIEFGLQINQKTREQKLLKKYEALSARLGLSPTFTKKLFRHIFSYSKKNATII